MAPSNPADIQSRRIDRLLATLLAVYPLLPSGPLYFGLADANYSHLGFLALLAAWAVGRVREPRSPTAEPAREAGREVVWAWSAFAVIATGAALVGLSAENDFSSPVFWEHLQRLPVSIGFPMDMVSDPMYPVAVWLVLVQGAIAFAAVRDLCLRASNPRRRARTALYGWLVGYAMVAVFALIQYPTRFRLHPYWVAVNPELVRSHSTLEDPNMLGTYLVLGLGVGLGLAWYSRPTAHLSSRMGIGLSLLGGAALFTSVSRTAWIAAVLSTVLFLAYAPSDWRFCQTRRYGRLRLAARVLLLTALLVGLMSVVGRLVVQTEAVRFEPTSPFQAVAQTLDPRVPLTQVFTGRLEWWRAAFTMFANQPLVGVGLGRYPRLVGEYAGPGVPAENSHSFPLQVLGETGGLGFAGLVLLVVAVFSSLLRAAATENADDAAITRGGLLGTMAFVVTCVAAHPLLLASGQTTLATILAVVLVASHRRTQEDIRAARIQRLLREESFSRWRLAAISMVGVALLWYPAAAMRSAPPPWKGATWGYSWGLFAEEMAQSGPFRWTGQRAIVDIEVPPGATSLDLEVAAPDPIRDGQPTRARFQLGSQVKSRTFRSADRRVIQLVIVPADVDERQRIRLVIEVEPGLIPSESLGSRDTRELGLQLFIPRWDIDPAGPDPDSI